MSAHGVMDPSKLPPTIDAAYMHTLCSIYQVKVWKDLSTNNLDPVNYGWELKDKLYAPVKSIDICAPDSLLNLVRCKCKSLCQSANCSCKKHGLSCAAACKNCRGNCENSQVSSNIDIFEC